MNSIEKIKKLIDKQNGIGISKTILAYYCGCHPTTLDYYLKGAKPSEQILEQYENGLKKFLNEIISIIEE